MTSLPDNALSDGPWVAPVGPDPARKAVLNAIADAESIVITSHPKPDGDAIGSSLGLARLLSGAGKQVVVAGLDPIPRAYADLAKPEELCDAAKARGRTCDVLIAVDVASRERLPEGLEKVRPRGLLINIDHHADNTEFGDINLVDAAASSTGEMLYYLAVEGGYALSRASAEPLWVAIVTDTGRFSHANTTPRAMVAAAALLEHGVATADINRRLYGTLTHSELELQRRVLQSLTFHEGGRVVFAALTPADFAAAACGPEAIGDLIEIPRSIEGVEVAVLFYEHASRPGTHVSTRSTTSCDVGALCRALGGGGHTCAAGCTISGGMEFAQAKVLEALRAAGTLRGARKGGGA